MEAIPILITMSIALSGGSGKSANPALVGTWKVQVSQEVLDVAHKMGLPEPQALFVFKDDNTFSFTSPGKSYAGTFEGAEHTVKLVPSSGSPLVGELKNNNSELDVDGLKCSKNVGQTSLAGTWTLRTSSGEDRSVKIVFNPDGTFVFSGQMATSRGKYTVSGPTLNLDWTEVDNEKVNPGSIHKSFPLAADGSLQIDSFRYVRN